MPPRHSETLRGQRKVCSSYFSCELHAHPLRPEPGLNRKGEGRGKAQRGVRGCGICLGTVHLQNTLTCCWRAPRHPSASQPASAGAD